MSYPLGMKSQPSSGYNHQSTTYNRQYVTWKGSGVNSNPVGTAPGHIRPLTNNDPGNVFQTGFGLPRPIKHFRKGRVIPPQPITGVTMFYNHPAVTGVRLNFNNPRFDYDFEKNYYNKGIFTQINPNLNNCTGADKNCQKCMKVDKTNQFGCLKCKPAFKILENNVCFAVQNS